MHLTAWEMVVAAYGFGLDRGGHTLNYTPLAFPDGT